MAKKRIYEIAKELGISNKVVVDKAKDLGFDVKNHMSSLDDSQMNQLKGSFRNSAPAKKQEKSSKRAVKLKFLFLLFVKVKRITKITIINVETIEGAITIIAAQMTAIVVKTKTAVVVNLEEQQSQLHATY